MDREDLLNLSGDGEEEQQAQGPQELQGQGEDNDSEHIMVFLEGKSIGTIGMEDDAPSTGYAMEETGKVGVGGKYPLWGTSMMERSAVVRSIPYGELRRRKNHWDGGTPRGNFNGTA